MSTPSPSPDVGRMRYRKLRIVWSVFCGLVATVLLVWWTQSYTQAVSGNPYPLGISVTAWDATMDAMLKAYANPNKLQLDMRELPPEISEKRITLSYNGTEMGFFELLHSKTGA